MSRIGKQIITVPAGVEVTIQGSSIKVKGTKGELNFSFNPLISIVQEGDILRVERADDEAFTSSLHGLTRAIVNNMVVGVSVGFKKKLEIIGVGYRAQISGKKLTLNLGFSHPIEMQAPAGVTVEMDAEQKNTLVVSGPDRQAVGQFAANIRSHRPPEPYKGKGIRYSDEHVRRKAGKAAGKDK
jgi:large subunit ribosomal protein L6